MADKDFRQIMIDPDGGEFVAGSPEVVARLKAQGYREGGDTLTADEARADENEQQAADEPKPLADGGEKADDTGGNKPAPKLAQSPDQTDDTGGNKPAPKPGAKSGTESGKPASK